MVHASRTVGGLFGPPGVGKTWQLIDMATRYCELTQPGEDYKICIVNFDNLPIDRAEQCIDDFFPDFKDNIELLNVLQKGKKRYKNKSTSRNELFGELESDSIRIDYVKSYEHLVDVVIPYYLENYKSYSFVGIDGYFPTIRKPIGKEVWKSKNPGRGDPVAFDWGVIGQVEVLAFNKFVMPLMDEDDPHNVPIVFTGIVTDNYVNGNKAGQTIDIHDDVDKSMTYYVELFKSISKSSKKSPGNGKIEIIVRKSTKLPWKDTIEPFGEYDLLTILIENGVFEV